jgi:hypothetical protein
LLTKSIKTKKKKKKTRKGEEKARAKNTIDKKATNQFLEFNLKSVYVA